ncbi:MAG: hypothetical protein L6R37_008108 [Teloschistes peruensis]|nr:MAG: hypothetical protein L6R37_008108 [Teloschistes peruensis]
MADAGNGKDLPGKRDQQGSKDGDGSSDWQQQPPARPSESGNHDGRARHSQYREIAQATLRDPSDREVQEAYRRRYQNVDPRDRPSWEVILDRAAQLMSILRERSSPRATILLLANAGWDHNAALQQFTQSCRQQAQRLEEQVSKGTSWKLPERPAARKQESRGTGSPVVEQRQGMMITSTDLVGLLVKSMPNDDIVERQSPKSDDDLPFPKDIKTMEVDDPILPGRKGISICSGTHGFVCRHLIVRAIFHHQIRAYLIERDQRLYGAYRYPHQGHPTTKGTPFEDQTAPHPDQINWCFTRGKDHLPSILLQWQRAGRPDPQYGLRPMYWRRHLVLDTDQNPILDFRHIPSTLASNTEGGLLEALERSDSRVRHQDLAARQYGRTPLAWPTLKDLKNHDNKLAQQMRRFRERNASVPWTDKRSGSEAFVEWVRENLSEEQRAANTTRGLSSPSESRFHKLKLENAGKNPERARGLKDKERNKAYLDGLKRRVEKAEAKEMAEFGEVMEFAFNTTSPKDKDMPDPDSDPEFPSDYESEPYDFDDPRGHIAKTDEEAEAWRRAVQPTIDDFTQQTSQEPCHINTWKTTYWAIYLSYQRHLIRILGLPRTYYAYCPKDAPFKLKGLGRWDGGILDWKKARYYKNPNASPSRY